jgi:hypothetical protein
LARSAGHFTAESAVSGHADKELAFMGLEVKREGSTARQIGRKPLREHPENAYIGRNSRHRR